jgi:hypothetical protein
MHVLTFGRTTDILMLKEMAEVKDDNFTLSLAIVGSPVWVGVSGQSNIDAIGICGDRIAVVGSEEKVLSHCSQETKIIRVPSCGLVVPGFHDCHVHLLDSGLRLLSVALRDAKTKDEFVQKVKAHAQTVPEGEWILGGDWDHQVIFLFCIFFSFSPHLPFYRIGEENSLEKSG